ncbi:NADH dehydrogenase [ubiquinone] 1 subunit C2 [Daktulosphaira vitifoliae]|uniref:NADH dehydrogenase [ubiquinone] 1 subunit C2 n=1 Tax=Daktulosphaira vitifoliae TaxID=58002 RepID=UPI0021A9850E|nr:NADH dehydrogenase [ubiquinone] 1 subunit C2 [Daktulosphaira vitifoliae]
MKPIVDYEVATVTDPTPLKLLTPDADYAKYHNTWLEDKWFPFMGFVMGAGSNLYGNIMSRRPFYAGIHKTLGLGAIAAYGFYYFKQYRNDYLADKDAMYRHYIQLHPEDFPAPERKKVGEMFKEWVPVR